MPILAAGRSGGGGASGDITVTRADIDNIRIDGNTISSTDANGNVVIDTNGNGLVQVPGNIQIVNGGMTVYAADEEKAQIAGGAGGMLFAVDTDLRWYNDADISSGSADTGLKRVAAAALQGTAGAAGNLASFRLTPTVGIYQATGSPEGAVTAGIGSLFLRTDGGAGTSLYVKESGVGNTGWVAK